MAECINQLEEELRQERAKKVTRHFMPTTVAGRRNYYGLLRWVRVRMQRMYVLRMHLCHRFHFPI
jgi:hypothetical protein